MKRKDIADVLRSALFETMAAFTIAVTIFILLIGCRQKNSDPTSSTSDASPTKIETNNASALLVDVSRKAGIEFVHDAVRTGDFLFPEISGAGCAFLDFDNDGRRWATGTRR